MRSVGVRDRLSDDASDLCKQAARIVAPEMLRGALHFLDEDYTAPHAHRLSGEPQLRRAIAGIARHLRRRAAKLGTFAQPGSKPTRDRAVTVLILAAEQLDLLVAKKVNRGPARNQLLTLRIVYGKLRAEGFDDGDIVDLIRSSSTDWEVPPCPRLVKAFCKDTVNQTGRERLKVWFKGIVRRRGWKQDELATKTRR